MARNGVVKLDNIVVGYGSPESPGNAPPSFSNTCSTIIKPQKLNALIHNYTLLVKDRQLVSAETMREYNDVVSSLLPVFPILY